MHIVAARVHDADDLRRVGQTGYLCHGQRVHIRASKDNGAVSVPENADNAGSTETRYLIATSGELFAENLRRLVFLQTQLRMLVQVEVNVS
jgi:hypothetical protein